MCKADLSLCWSQIPHFGNLMSWLIWSLTTPSARLWRWPPQGQCILHAHVLEAVSSARYFEVDISSKLSWKSHVDRITPKANGSPQIREMAYQSLVHSQLEYASVVWGLYTKDRTQKVEMVQRRAAWWTLSDYTRTNSVTSLQSQLN